MGPPSPERSSYAEHLLKELSETTFEPIPDPEPDMDTVPTTKQLHTLFQDRINADISQLLQRFENIMAIASAENTSYAAIAVESYQMDVESTALIRAAEDLLVVTRIMKEIWLFGKLDTVGEDERDIQRREQLEKDVASVQNAIYNSNLLKPSPQNVPEKK
ncbi:hypothetical protein N7462_010110 [Penicillium macrosclerotiorum]|uniref:uncharacterized protein n=1 Tax=Penicillium macrosclerotiorum TaxID=303699 RepID=UPI0025481D09|nr:uncharacterized protein N7462_010110 [Penicillium macrosclerotiorum]KAJ5669040.1 hypothetical protein N7462_010110 [Penicillium macrosclerotiorum]